MDGSEEKRGCICSTSRRIVSRLLFGLGRRHRARKKDREGKREKAEEVVAESGHRTVRGVTSGFNGGDSENPAPRSGNSEGRNELSKMAEMRTQMETFLQSAREELQMKDALSRPPKPNDIFVYDNTADVSEGLDSESQLSPQVISTSYALPESSEITVCDQSPKCGVPEQEERWEEMDQLEAELEAELERLQLQLETEKLATCSHKQCATVTTEDSASLQSHSAGSGEVIDPLTDTEHEETELAYGVPPRELERRLHELLEARQKEQIRELEAALESIKQKLHDKEMEISRLKDTASLLSHHLPETSGFSSQSSPKTHSSSL